MKLIESLRQKPISIKHITIIVCLFILVSSVSALMLGFVIPKEVTIVDNGQEKVVTTARIFVEEVLAEQGIVLRQGDRISVSLDAIAQHESRIVIERGTKIVLTDGGVTEAIYSCETVLSEALKDRGITLNETDEIEPALDTEVTEGMEVNICRVNVFEETKSEPILKKTVTRKTIHLPVGKEEVIEEGWNGARSLKYRVVTRNGEEVSREVLEDTVLWDACDTIIEVGVEAKGPIPGMKVVVDSPSELNASRVITCTATAYDASPASNGIYAGQTASGMKPAYGVIAVDPRVIPLGTKLYIEAVDGSWSYGYAIAGDTGGAIKGNKIDLFYNTAYECRQFGRRQAKVYVLE
ncbi:MAG: DUF348 domain-containing protein [Ruminococcaceae bacterium]|nr:DUF348 domain-containing protein [Oscillospiraceae bacterium]